MVGTLKLPVRVVVATQYPDVKESKMGIEAKIRKLQEALLAVYNDIDIPNVKGGSDELNLQVQEALEGSDEKH